MEMFITGGSIDACAIGIEVLNGAYGVLAYTRNAKTHAFAYDPPMQRVITDARDEYRPQDLAVVGNTDVVHYSAHDGNAVAVIEVKIYHQQSLDEYHTHHNAICAQLFASLIGSGAPVGIILGNGRFKMFWRKVVNGKTHLYTYPVNNSMANMAVDTERIFFTQVMFQIVRCSINIAAAHVPSIRNTIRVTESRMGSDHAPNAARYNMRTRQPSPTNTRYGGTGNHGRSMLLEAPDGNTAEFIPFDFTSWTTEQRQNLFEDIKAEEERIKEEREIARYNQSAASKLHANNSRAH
jgi:hypothetical protein